jgi:aspartate/methionine/tyrosine aminotransferase
MRKIQDTLLICPPVISQHAAIGALQAGFEFVRDKLRAIGEVRAVVRHQLQALVTDGICEVPPAPGAFYFLLRVRSTRSSFDVARELIQQHGVAVIPGNAFGLEQGCYLRVAYGALQRETASEGIGRLVRGLRLIS